MATANRRKCDYRRKANADQFSLSATELPAEGGVIYNAQGVRVKE